MTYPRIIRSVVGVAMAGGLLQGEGIAAANAPAPALLVSAISQNVDKSRYVVADISTNWAGYINHMKTV